MASERFSGRRLGDLGRHLLSLSPSPPSSPSSVVLTPSDPTRESVCCDCENECSFPTLFQAIQPFLAYKYIAWLLHPVITLTMTASIWMVVLITSERHLAIWRPLSFRSRDTLRRARLIVVLIALFAVVLNAPTLLELEIIQCAERNGTMGAELAPTALRYSMLYNTLYRILCYFFFITVCPFSLILVLTIRCDVLFSLPAGVTDGVAFEDDLLGAKGAG